MEKVKCEHSIELERAGEGEYVLRIRMPQIKISPDPTGGHLKKAKNEILLAVRNLIDQAIKVEEERHGE